MPKKVSTTKKSGEMAWDTPAFPDIEMQGSEPTDESAPVKAKKGGDDQAALLASLQQQVANLSSRNEELQRTTIALMSAPTTTPANGAGTAPVKMDMSNLPDPTLDPERYAQAVAERASQFVAAQQDANTRAANSRNDRETRVQTLWNDFSTAYEDYADPDKVDYVAQRVVKNMQARGVDPEKYMFGAKDTFFRDVVTEYEKVFGKPTDEPDANAEDDDPPSRTGGIFGGLESGGGRSAGADNDPKSDMLTEIQSIQKKSGFY